MANKNQIENIDVEKIFPEELLESMKGLSDMVTQQADIAAANLYRAMFRHERNLRILDQWADRVLDGTMWSEGAREDYQNYIRYIEAHDKEKAKEYREMYEDMIKEDIDEDE